MAIDPKLKRLSTGKQNLRGKHLPPVLIGLMRQCPLKHKECPLKRPSVGRVVRSFEIQVAKATNGQTNGSVEESGHALNLAVGGDAFKNTPQLSEASDTSFEFVSRSRSCHSKIQRLMI